MTDRLSRRRFGATVVTGGVCLAGCLGTEEEDTDAESEEEAVREDLLLSEGRQLTPEFPVQFHEPDTTPEEARRGIAVTYIHAHEEFVHWHNDFRLQIGGRRSVWVYLLDRDRDQIAIGPGGEFGIDVRRTGDGPADALDVSVDGERILFDAGSDPQRVLIVLDVLDDEAVVWTSPELAVVVGDPE